MKYTRITGAQAALVPIMAAALAACGSSNGVSAPDPTNTTADSATSVAQESDVAGVTADTIRLGHITDLTGPWGPVGKKYLSGSQLWVDAVNASGGVCDREVELVVRDHKNSPEDAVAIYRELEPDVLGMQSILGTGPMLSVAPNLDEDKVLTSTYAWDRLLLDGNETIFLPGATYEASSINLTEWVVNDLGLQEGDTIGLIRYDGIFEGVVAGMEMVADEYGLEFIDQTVQVTDSDFTGPVGTFSKADAKMVMAAVGTGHIGTFASTAASQGFEPVIGSPSPGNFDESLLAGPAKEIFETRSYFASPFAAWDDQGAGPQEVRDAFSEHGEGEPHFGLMLGYAQSKAYGAILEAACESGDLTRDSLIGAFQSTGSLGTEGIMTELDFTRGAGKTQSTTTRILQPDSSVVTGFREVEAPFESSLLVQNDL